MTEETQEYWSIDELVSLTDEVQEKEKGGRPPEGIKSGQHDNELGWDVTGRKTIKQAFDVENQKSAFQPTTRNRKMSFTTENNNLIKSLKNKYNKTPNIITESLKDQKTDQDTGTMLDEDNILE